jgi:hypothetical protein
LLVVPGERADVMLDPLPYKPSTNKRKAGRLLGEHKRRVGDPNLGGSAMRTPADDSLSPGGVASRGAAGQQRADEAAVRAAADAPRAPSIRATISTAGLSGYERGVYTLTPAGRRGLSQFDRSAASP